jgi:hypothetical protein
MFWALWDNIYYMCCVAASVKMALMMEAVNTSETLVYFYENTWRHIPQSCRLCVCVCVCVVMTVDRVMLLRDFACYRVTFTTVCVLYFRFSCYF